MVPLVTYASSDEEEDFKSGNSSGVGQCMNSSFLFANDLYYRCSQVPTQIGPTVSPMLAHRLLIDCIN